MQFRFEMTVVTTKSLKQPRLYPLIGIFLENDT